MAIGTPAPVSGCDGDLRKSKMTEKTHILEVPGIGLFTFRRRTMGLEFKMGAEYSRLTEGVETPTTWLATLATATAALKVLTVEAPKDWDIDGMDPEDDTTYSRIMEVYGALRAAEARFRSGRGAAGQGCGAGTGGEPGAVVPPDLQSTPD